MNEAWQEEMEDWIEVYDAIQTMARTNQFDDEEKATYEHNILWEIIEEFRRELKKSERKG